MAHCSEAAWKLVAASASVEHSTVWRRLLNRYYLAVRVTLVASLADQQEAPKVRNLSRAAGIWVGLSCALAPGAADALDRTHVSEPADADGALEDPGAAEETLDVPWHEYWENQRSRLFVAGQAGVGAFNQVTVQAGYGRPFWIWGGLQVQAASTLEFGSVLVGPRFDGVLINAMLNVRQTWAYSRTRPPTSESYDSFGDDSDPSNDYASLDAWLWGYVPLGPLLGYWEVSSVYSFTDPGNYALFEEYYRLVLDRQWGMMARTTLVAKFHNERILVGPAADIGATPNRDPLVRLGGSFSWQFTSHLGVQVLLTVPVTSPDGLDAWTQSWGLARLSYSLASSEPRPGL